MTIFKNSTSSGHLDARARLGIKLRTKGLGGRVPTFEAADREAPLEPEDLRTTRNNRLLLIQREDESEARLRTGRIEHPRRGDAEGTAPSAFRLAVELQLRGAMAPASESFATAQHILDENGLECVSPRISADTLSHYKASCRGMQPLEMTFLQSDSREIARRYGDRNLACKADQGRGRALIRLGRVRENILRLLDEAILRAMAGDVSPMIAGDAYPPSFWRHARRFSICAVRTSGPCRWRDRTPHNPDPVALSRRVPSLSRRGHAIPPRLG